MKRIILASALVVFAASSAFAVSNIATSLHNLRNSGTSLSKGASDELCRYCHTPHNPVVATPLWNRANPTAPVTTFYANAASLNFTPVAPVAGSVSMMCLSCHDSAINVQADASITLGAAPTGINLINNRAGDGLASTHPINFTYDATLATNDGTLVSPASTSQVVAGVPLFGGKVECASCHAVHDDTNMPFLRFNNAGSALCLKCHAK